MQPFYLKQVLQLYKLILPGTTEILICVSGLQNGWVTLDPFHVLVFYKMDG